MLAHQFNQFMFEIEQAAIINVEIDDDVIVDGC